MNRHWTTALLLISLIATSGCATHYITPAGGVTLADMADTDLRSYYEREPASAFPAAIAVVRVQGQGYETLTSRGYGRGRYSVVTTRDIESDEAFGELGDMPLVAGVAPVGRLLLPSQLRSIRDLRTAAAKLRADMLLIYSVDTSFTVGGQPLGPLTLIFLGLIPNKQAHVTATVAGILVDVRTGFIYGTTEATAREDQNASVWSTDLVIDEARIRAERQAFDGFVTELQELWGGLLDARLPAQAGDTSRIGQPDGYYRISFVGQ